MNHLPFFAYEVREPDGFAIVPAQATRSWMKSTNEKFAERCLPMLISNQAGWFVLNNRSFRATWDGSNRREAIKIKFLDVTSSEAIQSHFGEGVITWRVPYLFRTPPGYNLLVRGPANLFKDGVCPLEGIVETDWNFATFTMNWKFTRAKHTVEFYAGEPICMLVPQKRGELEMFDPVITELSDNPEIAQAYKQWHSSRTEFLKALNSRENEAIKQGWQKDYFQGRSSEGVVLKEHQTRLNLREFKRQAKNVSREDSNETEIDNPCK